LYQKPRFCKKGLKKNKIASTGLLHLLIKLNREEQDATFSNSCSFNHQLICPDSMQNMEAKLAKKAVQRVHREFVSDSCGKKGTEECVAKNQHTAVYAAFFLC